MFRLLRRIRNENPSLAGEAAGRAREVDEWSAITSNTVSATIAVDFSIDNFRYRIQDSGNNEKALRSKEFSVNNSEWQIVVFPRTPSSALLASTHQNIEGKSTVFLLNRSGETLKASYNIKIGTKIIMDLGMIIEGNKGKHIHTMDTRASQDYLSENDILSISLKLTVYRANGDTLLSGKKILDGCAEDIKNSLKILADSSFADFSIKSNEGRDFPCHRCFLAAGSDVLRAMLEKPMKENLEAEMTMDYSDTIIENFLQFLYTGTTEEDILAAAPFTFLKLGDYYNVPGLKKISEDAMLKSLTTTNMVSYFIQGDIHNGMRIREAAKTHMRQNKQSLMEQDDWKEPLVERPDLFAEFMELFIKS